MADATEPVTPAGHRARAEDGGDGDASVWERLRRSGDDDRDASLWERLRRWGGDDRTDAGTEPDADAGPAWTLDRILATVGAILLPAGVVAIGLAWYGAARTPFLFEQIPYMISGGLLGLGLLTAGGLIYIGTWIARLAEEQREQSVALREVLEGLRSDLAGDGAGDATTAAVGGSEAFVATPTGSMFHLRDCAVVADRTDLHSVNGQAADLQPCKMCDPLEHQATGT